MDTNKIREALEAAANLTELNPNNYGSDDVWDCIQQVREVAPLAEEALAELDKAQQPAEPVAGLEEAARQWYLDRYHVDVDQCGHGHSARRNVGDLVEFAALHTHPPKPEQPGKVLTVEEVMEEVLGWAERSFVIGGIATHKVDDLRARLTAAINVKQPTA